MLDGVVWTGKMSTYTVNADALALDADYNFCALPLLNATDAAHTSSMYAPVGRIDRLGQRGQCKGRANFLVRRHGFRGACRVLREV